MLTDDEILQFKRDGYLVKRGIIDKSYCATACDRLWDDPPPSLSKDDPKTWIGPIKPEEESEDPDNFKKGYRWQYRKVSTEPWMREGLSFHPFVQSVVNQLLGKGRFTQPESVRGIYGTLPYGDVARTPRTMHIDAGQATIGVVCYVDRVEPDGGGFALWPGSHRKFWYVSRSRYRRELTDEFDPIRQEYDKTSETSSVQTYGDPGDIVFWHRRMAHMASPNYTSNIRKAVLTDFSWKNVDELAELPPGEDMWEDWADAVRDVGDERNWSPEC